MSKQRPDPDKITNELSGASSFFRRSAAPPPGETAAPVHAQPAETPAPVSTPPSEKAVSTHGEPRTPVRPARVVKRQMIRHPFELYMDQLERLRETAQTEREHGGSGSMSRMVRDAIDQFLDHLPPASN